LTIQRALERKHLLDILDIDKQKALPRLSDGDHFRAIVTRSRNVLKVLKEAELHARSDVPILISGDSGTGKELLARAIHAASPRAPFPLTPVNMAAISESLFDAEFFGHAKGAFTGAEKERIGYLEHTHKGTLFLDEIGIMPSALQGKLLRVLQNGEYMKIGTNTPRKSDVRIIAATNEDMEQLVEQKRFRKDLYYRLRGGWLHLPPLRERKADIPLLASLFLEEFLGKGERRRMDVQTLSALMNHDYPGNIRELKSIIQSAVNLAQGGPVTVQCLPETIRTHAARKPETQVCIEEDVKPLAQVEKAHILTVYRLKSQNKSQTARALGIGLNTLRRRLSDYGVQ
jgi:transcriptional regulator with PAS, ATPase and Fis domain